MTKRWQKKKRNLTTLGTSLEFEQAAKAEMLRAKKNLEVEINELEMDHSNKANNERKVHSEVSR